jgi:hypothetical protein
VVVGVVVVVPSLNHLGLAVLGHLSLELGTPSPSLSSSPPPNDCAYTEVGASDNPGTATMIAADTASKIDIFLKTSIFINIL